MRYADIQHQILRVTSNLELIPNALLHNLLTTYWSETNYVDVSVIKEGHHSIKCVIHYLDTLNCICTVLVDGVPALFFIADTPDGYHHICHILHANSAKVLIELVVSMSTRRNLQDITISTVNLLDDVAGLTNH
jgi:hypothetical protein